MERECPQHRGRGDMGDTGTQQHTAGALRQTQGVFPPKGNMVNKQIGEPGSQATSLSVSTLSLANCMTLDKLIHLSCASVPPSVYGDNTIPYKVVIWIK